MYHHKKYTCNNKPYQKNIYIQSRKAEKIIYFQYEKKATIFSYNINYVQCIMLPLTRPLGKK